MASNDLTESITHYCLEHCSQWRCLGHQVQDCHINQGPLVP